MPGSTTRVPDAPPAVGIMPSAGGASVCVLRGPRADGRERRGGRGGGDEWSVRIPGRFVWHESWSRDQL